MLNGLGLSIFPQINNGYGLEGKNTVLYIIDGNNSSMCKVCTLSHTFKHRHRHTQTHTQTRHTYFLSLSLYVCVCVTEHT
jgi:hypothetical protein